MTDHDELIAEARERQHAWYYTSSRPSQTEGVEYRRLMIALADALEAATARTDREPQPGDGPDYHAEHASWLNRNRAVVEAHALEQYADQRWGKHGPDRVGMNGMFDEELRLRARAVEIREGRQ